jgi:hypothetical protein
LKFVRMCTAKSIVTLVFFSKSALGCAINLLTWSQGHCMPSSTLLVNTNSDCG